MPPACWWRRMSDAAARGWIPLSDPDMSEAELAAVCEAICSPRLSAGPLVEAFESAFAAALGRRHAVAVASGTIGLMLALRAQGIDAGDEVIAAPFGWRGTAHAIALAGATPVFVDVDYWTGSLAPDKAAERIGPRTRAIVAANINGHPAAWEPLRALASKHGLLLIEDSTEAIGSRYAGRPVGSFGDIAVFDFSQPSALCCGEGGMLVTDDADAARRLRWLRDRAAHERASVTASAVLPLQAQMGDVTAALGLAQLRRLDAILERRKSVEAAYLQEIQSFEGIKPPYLAPEADEVHWFMMVVHLGTRFTRSSRNAIIEDLRTHQVEAAPYCEPLHAGRWYVERGARRGSFPVTEKLADRAIALPFHAHLTDDQVRFIVKTAKDASINVGAGSAIYL